MAHRYPLVLDTGNDTIRELPSGDNLNLSGTTGIYDGSGTGSNGQVLHVKIFGAGEDYTENSSGVEWRRYPDVYLSDTQTLQNKTFGSTRINASSTTVSNIANNSLANPGFTFLLSRKTSTAYNATYGITETSKNLGQTYAFTDTNDNSEYSITCSRTQIVSGSAGDSFNSPIGTTKAVINLIGTDGDDSTIRINADPDHLTITEPVDKKFLFTFSMESLTSANYFVKDGGSDKVYTGYNGYDRFDIFSSATNSANRIVNRNSSGNFSAGTIYADLDGSCSRVSKALSFASTLDAYDPDNSNSKYSTFTGTTETALTVNASVGDALEFGKGTIATRNSNGDFFARDISASNVTTNQGTAADRRVRVASGNNIGFRVPEDGGGYKTGFLKGNGTVDTKSYIVVSSDSNAYGTRYVQNSSPSGTIQNGDIWYEIL